MRVLVVAAHPDDEVLGCGGTMARLAAEGHDVHVVILGEGLTSRTDGPADTHQIETAAEMANGSLGVCSITFCRLPDNRFDTVPLLQVAQILEALITRLQPSVVYTQGGGDLNLDHVVAYRATLIATRPGPQCPVREVYAYEVGSSTEWAFGQFAPIFQPNTYVDITDYLDRKISAMEMYETERRPYPHPRSAQALRAQAMNRGVQTGLRAAEAFQLVQRAL